VVRANSGVLVGSKLIWRRELFREAVIRQDVVKLAVAERNSGGDPAYYMGWIETEDHLIGTCLDRLDEQVAAASQGELEDELLRMHMAGAMRKVAESAGDEGAADEYLYQELQATRRAQELEELLEIADTGRLF